METYMHFIHKVIIGILGFIGAFLCSRMYLILNKSKHNEAMCIFFLKRKETKKEILCLVFAMFLSVVCFIFYFLGSFFDLAKMVWIGRFISQIVAILVLIVIFRWWRKLKVFK